MNASKFMDKQIMDLSRSKSSSDFIDLMNPQEDDDIEGAGKTANKSEEIFPSFDFQPIPRPIGLSSDSAVAVNNRDASRARNSADSKSNSSPNRSCYYTDSIEPDKITLEKAPNADFTVISSEIDRTMKKHTDNLLHALDGLSARLTQLESRTRQLENSVDDMKVSIGNNYGSTDGKMRQLEYILVKVQNDMQDLKDKQDVTESHMQLSKLQMSNVEQLPETQKTTLVDPVESAASASQHSNQQFSAAVGQSLSTLPPPNAPPPAPVPSMPLPSQYPQGQMPYVRQRDAYFPPPGQRLEASLQQYQMPSPHQQPPQQPPPAPQQLSPGPQHQQCQPAPPAPYSQPPQPLERHPAVAAGAPQIQTLLGHRPEEASYIPTPSYQPNIIQPPSQPATAPQQLLGVPSHMYDPSTGRSSSGFSPGYASSQGRSEPFSYSGSPSRYGSGPSVKPPSHSFGGSTDYPLVPAARVLPQPMPTASINGSGGSGAPGGSGNRVPIDDVVDKVTNMGFPREHVRATVRKLTENGQSVDLNVVLDKLMNDGDVQPPRGWFGR